MSHTENSAPAPPRAAKASPSPVGQGPPHRRHWKPRVVAAEMNDYQFKVVKIEGDFVWHQHADTDETFIVLEGELHRPARRATCRCAPANWPWYRKAWNTTAYAAAEVTLLIEPRGVLNTGDGERTAANDIWI